MKKTIFNLIIGVFILLTDNINAQDKMDKEIVYIDFDSACSEKYKTNTIRNFTNFYIDGVRFVYDNKISPDTISCDSLDGVKFRNPPYLEKRRKEMITKNPIFMIESPFQDIFIVIKQKYVCLRYAVGWEPLWVQE